jgi:hypothetical protein
MKTKLLLVVVLLVVLFSSSGIVAEAQSANSKSSNLLNSGQVCQCVDYFVYKLNNGNRPWKGGPYPTAASMATTVYWDQTTPPRYRSQTAQAGDVVIMQSNAVVYPWRVNTPYGWDFYFTNHSIGWGAGHIGIVKKAEYWNDYGGWFITLQSANWSSSWGMQYSDAGCSNVSDSQIFIPNGNLVSFWRAKK